MSLKLSVVSSGPGTCSFSGKPETDGLLVAFENEAPAFLSWKAFRQLLATSSGGSDPIGTRAACLRPLSRSPTVMRRLPSPWRPRSPGRDRVGITIFSITQTRSPPLSRGRKCSGRTSDSTAQDLRTMSLSSE